LRPEVFRQEVSALPAGSWVVVDEVQKLPGLLNEVHSILFEHGGRIKFALSGSSARKLKRLDSNLLAGRVINRRLFPLSSIELGGDASLDTLLRFGCLPAVHAERRFAVDILEASIANYIREEIQQEAMVKDIGSFSRFLDIAAIMNGQILNTAGLARDAGVARPTVLRYLDVLSDTFIGVLIPAWRPKLKVREAAHPKFYLFDPGVVRALAGRTREPLERDERGPLLETLVLHELRAWMANTNAGGDIAYWRTPSGIEVDFLWSRGKKTVAIEVKSAPRWRPGDSDGLEELRLSGLVEKTIGVYAGDVPLKVGKSRVLPFGDFVKLLYDEGL
jgi:predicted AAA+ superfamily ATPase